MAGGLQRLQRGTYSDRGDQNGWTYYDTFALDGSTTSVRMFQTAWSGTKTKDKTNMKTAGMIPANQRFRITSIGLQYVGHAQLLTLVKVQTLLAGCVAELIINGKDASFQQTALQMIGWPLAVESMPAATFAIQASHFNHLAHATKLKYPIVLAANVPFEFDLTFAAANDATLTTDLIKIMLNGTLIRAM
jgi:hypothetical protein